MRIRLDKYLTLCDLGTRKEVQALIRAGRVVVNGFPRKDTGYAIDSASTFVEVDEKPVFFRQFVYIMMNKPPGYLSAVTDKHHPTIVELLPAWCRRRKVVPVGRLDLDTTGLIFLSDDGGFNHDMTSPRRHVDKVYHAELDLPIDASDIKAFKDGMRFKDFTAELALLTSLPQPTPYTHAAAITIHEGKYHQVKRMFAARGKQVLNLKRVAIGDVPLPVDLNIGYWRELTLEEMQALKIQNPYVV